MSVSKIDRFRGCLLGGAVGDALGAAVEFDSLTDIHTKHGKDGIRGFVTTYGRIGAITDDTQMTLFTAEGLIRADNRWHERGICNPVGVMHRAYLRWLRTQGYRSAYSGGDLAEQWPGWLINIRALHSRRAPGHSCLGALQSGDERSINNPINDSKGCGGVMRAAPAGLAFPEADQAFEFGCELAAITHGHPTGYLAAGFLAALICRLLSGIPLRTAINETLNFTITQKHSEELCTAVDRALSLSDHTMVDAEAVESLGKGWIAEEALAIAIYCALVATNFENGIIISVNHSGDSDSTGAITGNILGTLLGFNVIPDKWVSNLELHDEIETVSKDLYVHFHNHDFIPNSEEYERYPPN